MTTLSSSIVKRRVASMRDVEEALARQVLYGGDLATNLLELAAVREQDLTLVLAETQGLEAGPIGELPRAADATRRLVPGELALRHGLYPLEERDGVLLVAVSEPLPVEIEEDLSFSLGVRVVQRGTPLVRIRQAIARDYGLPLDQRSVRVLARLEGRPDPNPSIAPKPLTDLDVPSFPRPITVPPIGYPDVPADAEAQARAEASARSVALPEAPKAPEPAVDHSAVNEPAPSVRADASAPAPAPPPAQPRHTVAPGALLDLARHDSHPPRSRPPRLGPYTAAMAEQDLMAADGRDDVLRAFFDFASQYFDYSAVFAVHGDVAEGRDAHGPGADRAHVSGLGVPLDLPSSLAAARQSGTFLLTRLSNEGLDETLTKDLAREGGKIVLLLPIVVRGRCVLIVYGDHGRRDVELGNVGEVIAFAPLVSTALERLILRRKFAARRALDSQAPGANPTPLPLPTVQLKPSAPKPSFEERVATLARAISPTTPSPSQPPAARTSSSKPPAAGPVPATLRIPEAAAAAPVMESERARPPPVPKRPESHPKMAAPGRASDLRLPGRPPLEKSSAAMGSIATAPTKPAPVPSPLGPLATAPTKPAVAPQAQDLGSAPTRPAAAPAATASGSLQRQAPVLPPMPRSAASTGVEPPASPAPGQRMPSSMPPRSSEFALPMIAIGAARAHRGTTPPQGTPRPLATASAERSAPIPPLPRSSPPPEDEKAPSEDSWDVLSTAASRAFPEPQPQAIAAAKPPAAATRRVELVIKHADDTPELALGAGELDQETLDAIRRENEVPLAPSSRSIAHAARRPRAAHSSNEVRLPTVIVDVSSDAKELVERLISGDQGAGAQLVDLGEQSISPLVASFPGPITSELRKAPSEGPPRASECGPVLRVLSRIGPRASPFVIVRTNDRDPKVRAWATRLLGEMPTVDGARAIVRRMSDIDADVRRAASAAARLLQSNAEARRALSIELSNIAASVSTTEKTRILAVETLTELRDTECPPRLVELLSDRSVHVAKAAHNGLVTITRQDFDRDVARWNSWWEANGSLHRIDWLIDALMHDDADIRRAAGDELKTLTKEYFGYYDDLPRKERARAQQRYREWWESKGQKRFRR